MEKWLKAACQIISQGLCMTIAGHGDNPAHLIWHECQFRICDAYRCVKPELIAQAKQHVKRHSAFRKGQLQCQCISYITKQSRLPTLSSILNSFTANWHHSVLTLKIFPWLMTFYNHLKYWYDVWTCYLLELILRKNLNSFWTSTKTRSNDHDLLSKSWIKTKWIPILWKNKDKEVV